MSEEFAGRVALVTGGAAGIGRAAALAFARAGARVVVADVDAAGGAETARLIDAAGGAATCIPTDVTDSGQVAALVEAAVAAYGRLDCAFNNAGITGESARTADCSEENWQRVLAVNLTGVWLCMKYEITQMLRQGGGRIVNNASIAGLIGFPPVAAYCASKHGVLGLTKTAAIEYGRKNIRVNAVCPGWTQTPMISETLADPRSHAHIMSQIPIRRLAEPDEIAAAVLWLCSDGAAYVFGHGLVVDGGLVTQ